MNLINILLTMDYTVNMIWHVNKIGLASLISYLYGIFYLISFSWNY